MEKNKGFGCGTIAIIIAVIYCLILLFSGGDDSSSSRSSGYNSSKSSDYDRKYSKSEIQDFVNDNRDYYSWWD